MICPRCNIPGKGTVLATRQQDDEIIRKRLCINCRKGFYTREVPDLSIVLRVVKVKKKLRITLDVFNVWR